MRGQDHRRRHRRGPRRAPRAGSQARREAARARGAARRASPWRSSPSSPSPSAPSTTAGARADRGPGAGDRRHHPVPAVPQPVGGRLRRADAPRPCAPRSPSGSRRASRDDEIRAYFASRYGDEILLTPPAERRRRRWCGSLPVVALVVGGAGLAFAFRRWQRWDVSGDVRASAGSSSSGRSPTSTEEHDAGDLTDDDHRRLRADYERAPARSSTAPSAAAAGAGATAAGLARSPRAAAFVLVVAVAAGVLRRPVRRAPRAPATPSPAADRRRRRRPP